MTRRVALLVGNSTFEDSNAFPNLRTAANDAQEFARVLQQFGSFEIFGVLVDRKNDAIRYAVNDLFSVVKRGDLALFYYSGHGYKDRKGKHHLIAQNSIPDKIRPSSVSERYIKEVMSDSECRHKVVILDCCFSGEFIEGKKSGDEQLLLEDLKGEATAILTSSGRIQYSFEEEEGTNSLFTQFLLRGIETGKAARVGGKIYIEDLYNYAAPRVQEIRPYQTPMISLSVRESEILIAQSSQVSSASLPLEIKAALEGNYVTLCLAAIDALCDHVTDSDDDAQKTLARETLQQLCESHKETSVRIKASEALSTLFPPIVETPRISYDTLFEQTPSDYVAKVPAALRYSKEHVWLHVEADMVTIGLTDYAQDALSDIVYVELPEVGDFFAVNEAFGVIESVKAAADLYMPVTGSIVMVNEEIMDMPELVNMEPYEAGWMIKAKMSDPNQLKNTLDPQDYKAHCEEEG